VDYRGEDGWTKGRESDWRGSVQWKERHGFRGWLKGHRRRDLPTSCIETRNGPGKAHPPQSGQGKKGEE